MIGTKRKVNLSESAYNQIKDALCEGKIVPGDILSESQLAIDMGMSRTPVREALRALASEGWVEIKSGIGAYVKPLSTKDMEDLYEVRCLLETQAAKTAIYHITNEEIDTLEQRFQTLLAECQSGKLPDPKQFSDLDWELHELIIERCQNNYIKTIMHSNTSNMKRYQCLSAEALNDIPESIRQHLNILALLRNRDGEALFTALRQHLEWAAGFLKRTP
jgi:DNA-binding GntR family transcriptional regulator